MPMTFSWLSDLDKRLFKWVWERASERLSLRFRIIKWLEFFMDGIYGNGHYTEQYLHRQSVKP